MPLLSNLPGKFNPIPDKVEVVFSLGTLEEWRLCQYLQPVCLEGQICVLSALYIESPYPA
jgi:hypothetical protein